MQRYQRIRHRWIWPFLLILILLLFTLALRERSVEPQLEALPDLFEERGQGLD